MNDRTAAELAAGALRMAPEPDRADTVYYHWFRDDRAKALAALTAEAAEPSDYHERHQVAEMAARVSPDREALARRLTRLAVVCHAANIGIDGIPGDCLIADALAFIRAPAQAEVEAMAKRLISVALPSHENTLVQITLREAATLLIRLSSPSPAVGEWRPVSHERKPTIAELEAILASDTHEARIDPDGTVWERLKPAPPQETKP